MSGKLLRRKKRQIKQLYRMNNVTEFLYICKAMNSITEFQTPYLEHGWRN